MKGVAYLLIVLLFNFHLNMLYADYMVVTNKSVNLVKDNKVSARMDIDKKIIEGFGQITPSEKGMYIVDITWTNILDKNGKTALPSNALSTKTEIKGTVLTSGTGLLVKGSVSGNILGNPKEDDKDKEDDKRDYLGSSDGSTTDISAGFDNPVDTSNTGDIVKPDLITTYDGCNNIYNKEKETISVFQQTYYIDENNNKKVQEECHVVNEVPAEKKSCSTVDDFIAHVTYTRFQPIFTEEGKTYSAGGCVIDKTYMHQIDYNVCEAVAYGNEYIKQGKWYYQVESGEHVYISDCILDPYAEKNDLLIKFEGCPVYHDKEAGQSKYYGRYYWIKPDNTTEYLGDCVDVGDEGVFIHKLRWDGEWNYGDEYAQKIMTRYIEIESESREVIIDEELDVVKYNYLYKLVEWEHHDDKTPIHDAEDTHGGYSNKIQEKYFVYEGENLSVPDSEFTEKVKHTFDYAYESRWKDCSGAFHKGVENWYKDKIKRPDGTLYDSDEYHGPKHC